MAKPRKPAGAVKRLPTLRWSDAERMVAERMAPGYTPPAGSGAESLKTDAYYANWTGSESLPAAAAMLAGGWEAGTRVVAEGTARVLAEIAERPEWGHEVAGWLLDPVAFIAGDPECFWHKEPADDYRPMVRLVFPLAYSSNTPAEGVTRYAIALAALVRKLEEEGADVEVIGVDSSRCSGGHYIQAVEVRRFGQPLDLSKVAFAAHPSMLRRVNFAWRELDATIPEDLRSCGYGQHVALTPEIVAEVYGDGADVAVALPEVASLAPTLNSDADILGKALPAMLARLKAAKSREV